MNLLVSLGILFCLFSFRMNLWPHVLTKNTGKAFIHMAKINCLVTTLYEVFNRLQAFFFFNFLGINEGIKRKHILHFLVADQRKVFLALSRVPPQRRNSREIGKTCQKNWKIQHQSHDDYDFLIRYENETSSTTRLIILGFFLRTSIHLLEKTWHDNRRRWINFSLQMFELRIYKVVSNTISNWLSIRVQF